MTFLFFFLLLIFFKMSNHLPNSGSKKAILLCCTLRVIIFNCELNEVVFVCITETLHFLGDQFKIRLQSIVMMSRFVNVGQIYFWIFAIDALGVFTFFWFILTPSFNEELRIVIVSAKWNASFHGFNGCADLQFDHVVTIALRLSFNNKFTFLVQGLRFTKLFDVILFDNSF